MHVGVACDEAVNVITMAPGRILKVGQRIFKGICPVGTDQCVKSGVRYVEKMDKWDWLTVICQLNSAGKDGKLDNENEMSYQSLIYNYRERCNIIGKSCRLLWVCAVKQKRKKCKEGIIQNYYCHAVWHRLPRHLLYVETKRQSSTYWTSLFDGWTV